MNSRLAEQSVSTSCIFVSPYFSYLQILSVGALATSPRHPDTAIQATYKDIISWTAAWETIRKHDDDSNY